MCRAALFLVVLLPGCAGYQIGAQTLYPAHIRKEDKSFFLPAMDYLSDEEKASMVDAEREFDRKLIHRIYREKVDQVANGVGPQQ